jgi:3-oxoacyl-[acyl-carrier-protein] synthase II
MKVFVTGMGVMSSLGNSVDSLMENLLAGRTAVRAYPEWKVYRGLYSYLGAPVPEYAIGEVPRTARRGMSRMSEMAYLATVQALQQAKLPVGPELSSPRTLLCMGSTTGSPVTLETYFKKLFEKGGPEGQLSTSFFKVMNHSIAANVAVALNFAGPQLSPASACSTSTQAIILGWELIKAGMYDVVIAGGADELHYTSVAVFDIVQAASRKYNDTPELTPRPFDRARDGLVVSEGAGVVILESEAHARRRGVRPLNVLEGGAYFGDGFHMTQPQAQSMVTVMQLALERATMDPRRIGYVNAHATGTTIGDVEEAQATAQVVGSNVPVSSLKGHLGHSLAACGALDLIASAEMMRLGTLIPTRNLTEIDPQCAGINLLQEEKKVEVRTVMSNNFAFGGMSASLILSACEEMK